MQKKKCIIAIFFSLLMLLSAVAVISNDNSSAQSVPLSSSATNDNSLSAASYTPWTYPTTTMEEPGYTGGNFKVGIAANVGSVNPLTSTTGCDAALCEEIFEPLFKSMPNGANAPWLATGYTLNKTTGQTFDVETSSYMNYSAIYTVTLRPNVQWSDWTSANATDTYEFSNHTTYGNATQTFNHTFKVFATTKMKTYYLQSADVVLSWRMEASYGKWPNVVNVVPDGNMSVKFYVSNVNLLFVQNDLANVMLPYHIWDSHDFSTNSAFWNYTSSGSPKNAYNAWELGWNEKKGNIPYLVGTGPFMVNGGYNQPKGGVIPSQAFTMYVNPHYWVQYTPNADGFRQYTPKIAEVEFIYYSSASDMVSAMIDGNIYSMLQGTSPNFVPQLKSVPDMKICYTPAGAGGFSLMSLNTRYSPMNITAFRQALNYATPKAYLASVIESGYCVLGQPVVGPNDALYFNSSTNPYTFSLSKARSLINGIKGMANVSGVLKYNGNPVSLTIDLPSTIEAPLAAESAEIIKADWNKLGISVTLNVIAFTTEIADVSSSITDNTTAYQIASFESGAPIGDPAETLLCDYNSVVGIPSCSYSGPFSSITYNGKAYTGKQVDSYLNNLTDQLVKTDNPSVAIKLSKTIESLGVDESPIINLGYGLGISPISMAQFTNYSISDIHSTGWACVWNFLTMHKTSKPSTTSYSSQLSLSAKFENGTLLVHGQDEKIIFTVTNKTSGAAISQAAVVVGFNAPYGGVTNLTSSDLVTNSIGQASYCLKVGSAAELSSLMQGFYNAACCSGPKVNVYNEKVSISASAYLPNNPQAQPASYSQNFTVENSFNYPLNLNETIAKTSSLKAGENDTVSLVVTNSTTKLPVAGANITLTILLNNKVSGTTVLLKTNNSGQVTYQFVVPPGFTAGSNMTISAEAYTSPNNTTSQTGAGYVSVSVVSAANNPLYLTYVYIALGVVVAAVVVIGAVAFTRRSKKGKVQ